MEKKKLTPCEELGYKVGDQFTYYPSGDCDGFGAGSVIELSTDDGTDVPYFRLVAGTCKWDDDLAYVFLRSVTPLQKEEPWVALTSPEEVKTKLQVGSSVKLRDVVTKVNRMYTDDLGFETVEENPWDRDSITDSGQVRALFDTLYYKPSESPVVGQEYDTEANTPVQGENASEPVNNSPEGDLVKQPSHYLLFPEHELEVKHITKRVLDEISNSSMEMTLNQGGWLQQAMQYLLRCSAKGGWRDIEKAKEALEIMLKDKGE